MAVRWASRSGASSGAAGSNGLMETNAVEGPGDARQCDGCYRPGDRGSSPVLPTGAWSLPCKITVKVERPAAQRGRTTLTVILHGNSMPGAGGRVWLLLQARRTGDCVTAGGQARWQGAG